MKTFTLLLTIALLTGISATLSAQELTQLSTSYSAGDEYRLSVHFKRDGIAQCGQDKIARFDRQCKYRANVIVVKTGADGLPVVEEHQSPRLLIYADGKIHHFGIQDGSILVRRNQDDLQIESMDGEQLHGEMKDYLTFALQNQSTRLAFLQLLEPGEPVHAGDSWRPDANALRKYLQQEKITVRKQAENAQITYHGIKESESGEPYHVVSYSVPLEWITVPMAENVYASSSEGNFSGKIGISLHTGTVKEVSEIDYSISGSQRAYPAARPTTWTADSHVLRREIRIPLTDTVAKGF